VNMVAHPHEIQTLSRLYRKVLSAWTHGSGAQGLTSAVCCWTPNESESARMFGAIADAERGIALGRKYVQRAMECDEAAGILEAVSWAKNDSERRGALYLMWENVNSMLSVDPSPENRASFSEMSLDQKCDAISTLTHALCEETDTAIRREIIDGVRNRRFDDALRIHSSHSAEERLLAMAICCWLVGGGRKNDAEGRFGLNGISAEKCGICAGIAGQACQAPEAPRHTHSSIGFAVAAAASALAASAVIPTLTLASPTTGMTLGAALAAAVFDASISVTACMTGFALSCIIAAAAGVGALLIGCSVSSGIQEFRIRRMEKVFQNALSEDEQPEKERTLPDSRETKHAYRESERIHVGNTAVTVSE